MVRIAKPMCLPSVARPRPLRVFVFQPAEKPAFAEWGDGEMVPQAQMVRPSPKQRHTWPKHSGKDATAARWGLSLRFARLRQVVSYVVMVTLVIYKYMLACLKPCGQVQTTRSNADSSFIILPIKKASVAFFATAALLRNLRTHTRQGLACL